MIEFARTQPLSAENITFMKLKWFRYTIKHCLPGPAPGFLLGPGHYISTTVLLCLQNQINPQINDFCSKNCWTIFSFEYKLSKGIFTEIQFSWIESRQTFFRYVSDNVSGQIFFVCWEKNIKSCRFLTLKTYHKKCEYKWKSLELSIVNMKPKSRVVTDLPRINYARAA